MKAEQRRPTKAFLVMALVLVGTTTGILGVTVLIAPDHVPYQAPRISGPVPPQVLAFYYPWYGSGDYWPQRCAETPLLGNYASDNATVIYTHLQWAKSANITGFISSWWGEGEGSDINFATLLATAAAYPECRINLTVYYETYARPEAQIKEEFRYLIETYGAHPCFLHINGVPVIFVYGAGTVRISTWARVFQYLEGEGLHAYFIADSSDPAYFWAFSGAHTYNPLPSLLLNVDLAGTYRSGVHVARQYKILHCATVMPGYDDRKIHSPGMYLPRHAGITYETTWQAAMASGTDWVLITTFNEWWEGTEIEPSVNYTTSYLDATRILASSFLRG